MVTGPGPRILLTGFEPFAGDTLNPSGLVCRALHGQRVAHATVHAVELPCVFGQALRVLDEALAATSPVLVLALGLAAASGGGMLMSFLMQLTKEPKQQQMLQAALVFW